MKSKSSFKDVLLIIWAILSIVSVVGLNIWIAIFNWFHPEYTRMMLFQKFIIPECIVGLNMLCVYVAANTITK